MGRFEGQTVIVTGGTGGMGASHVRGYHAEGANVVVAARDVAAGRELAEGLGERALFVRLDVTSEDAWAAAVATAESRFGPVTILVNNAGVLHPTALIEETELPVWERVLRTNVTGAFLGIRAVVKSMRRAGGGVIVNIASAMSHIGTAFYAPYTVSKWAMRGLTKTAALELGRDNIRVNAIHPGAVSTPMVNEPVAEGQTPIADLFSPEPYAVPRLGEPADVTRLLLFVSSPEAAFATGSEFVVDGGLLLGPALQPKATAEAAFAA